MDNNILCEFNEILDNQIYSRKSDQFTKEELKNILLNIADMNNLNYYYSLRTQLNHHLQKTNFKDELLIQVSLLLNEMIDQYEYEQLSESNRNIRSVRENLSSAINLLDELHGKMKNEINK